MNIAAQLKPSTLKKLDRMASGHMAPHITFGDCWMIETTRGESFIVPADVHGIPPEARDEQIFDDDTDLVRDVFADYAPEGIYMPRPDRIASATVCRGVWLCRMSAPGYMDCTDWESHDTAQAAADSLIANYAEEGN
jgi:hypothetical protein